MLNIFVDIGYYVCYKRIIVIINFEKYYIEVLVKINIIVEIMNVLNIF